MLTVDDIMNIVASEAAENVNEEELVRLRNKRIDQEIDRRDERIAELEAENAELKSQLETANSSIVGLSEDNEAPSLVFDTGSKSLEQCLADMDAECPELE